VVMVRLKMAETVADVSCEYGLNQVRCRYGRMQQFWSENESGRVRNEGHRVRRPERIAWDLNLAEPEQVGCFLDRSRGCLHRLKRSRTLGSKPTRGRVALREYLSSPNYTAHV
jgi:hypothetical protein